MDVGHLAAQGLDVDGHCFTLSGSLEHAVAQGIERDAAVHGTGIDIYVAHFAGQVFGHGALSARRMAVNGYGNLFHYFIV